MVMDKNNRMTIMDCDEPRSRFLSPALYMKYMAMTSARMDWLR